jgi:ketosteroid isomerase-like protein
MMRGRRRLVAATLLAGAALAAVESSLAAEAHGALSAQVREAERAFAKTMADRDHEAFGKYVSQEALFFGRQELFRGRARVMEGWKRFYETKDAPFSWEPEQVEVLETGTLALSTGPVRDPQGNTIGSFSSIWRLEADGRWRVIFDKGCPPCRCP